VFLLTMHYQSEIQSCPFRNVVSIIFIIDSTHVRNTFGTRQDGSNDELMIATKGLPRGDTKFQHDHVSFKTALIIFDIWQRRTIVKVWETIWANDSVNFSLSFLLHFRIVCHHEKWWYMCGSAGYL
jgi:hypothetical protein